MASSETREQSRDGADLTSSLATGTKLSPWQRLLTTGLGIPMPGAHADASDELGLFTPEERRELRRAASEQCEANR